MRVDRHQWDGSLARYSGRANTGPLGVVRTEHVPKDITRTRRWAAKFILRYLSRGLPKWMRHDSCSRSQGPYNTVLRSGRDPMGDVNRRSGGLPARNTQVSCAEYRLNIEAPTGVAMCLLEEHRGTLMYPDLCTCRWCDHLRQRPFRPRAHVWDRLSYALEIVHNRLTRAEVGFVSVDTGYTNSTSPTTLTHCRLQGEFLSGETANVG